MKNLILILTLCISVLIGCKKDQQNSPVEISIQNNTTYQFNDLFVSASEGKNNYGTVNSFEKSSYKEFQKAYRYSYISLKIDNEELILQPVDYVGEIELEQGRHTYIISVEVVNNKKRLSLTYRKD